MASKTTLTVNPILLTDIAIPTPHRLKYNNNDRVLDCVL